MSIEKIITAHLHPLLQSASFAQTGEAFHRKLGTTIQCIEIQRSMGSSLIGPKLFFINIGVAFDALTALYEKPKTDRPSAFACDFHSRLSDLVLNSRIVWAIRGDGILDKLFRPIFTAPAMEMPFEIQDTSIAGQGLVSDMHQALAELNRIDGPSTFLQSRWKNLPGTETLKAILLYVADDLDGSWQELQRVSRKFPKQEGMTVPAMIERLKLIKLKDRLNQ